VVKHLFDSIRAEVGFDEPVVQISGREKEREKEREKDREIEKAC
jgi:hypothetical protein